MKKIIIALIITTLIVGFAIFLGTPQSQKLDNLQENPVSVFGNAVVRNPSYDIAQNFSQYRLEIKDTPRNELMRLETEGRVLIMEPTELKGASIIQRGNSPVLLREKGFVYKDFYDGINLSYTTDNSSVKEDIIISSPSKLDLTQDTFKISNFLKILPLPRETLTPIIDDTESLKQGVNIGQRFEIQNNDGEAIFYFDKPYAIDNDGNQIFMNIEVEEISPLTFNYNIIANSTWFEKASYPVIIDPTVSFGGSEDVEALSGTALNNNTFIMAYCDETGNHIEAVHYNISGTLLNSWQVDGSTTSCSKDHDNIVSVSPLNESMVVIAWLDSVSPYTRVYDYSGTAITSAVLHESNVDGVAVAALGDDEWVTIYQEEGTDDMEWERDNLAGSSLDDNKIFDTSSDESGGMDIEAYNDTTWVIHYHDDATTDATYMIIDISETQIATGDVDTNVGADGYATRVSILDNNNVIYSYNDGAANDALFRQYSGVSIHTAQYASKTLDPDVGNNDGNDVIRINDTLFITVTVDIVENNVIGELWDTSGTQYGSEIVFNTAASGADPLPITVMSSYFGNNIEFCQDAFTVAYSYANTGHEFKSFYANGTEWGGECPGEPDPPASDTCTYSSGNWEMKCYDNCTITTDVTIAGNLTIEDGGGNIEIRSNLTFSTPDSFIDIYSSACDVDFYEGGGT